MIAYVENTRKIYSKLLELMSEFGKALTIKTIDKLDYVKIKGHH